MTATEATGPWPREQHMPLATAGARPQPWHHQAVAEHDAAHGTTTEPNSTIPGMYAAAQINQAITWWNERAGRIRDAGQHEAPAVDPQARAFLYDQMTACLARFVDHEDTPCRLDHHGNCQEHGRSFPCAVATGRALLTLHRAGGSM